MQNKEQCVRIGTLIEIVKFLNIPARSFDRVLKKNEKINGRYELHYLYKEKEVV